MGCGGYPWGIAVDATHVYWTENLGNSVMSVPINGGAAVQLAADARPTGIAVDSTGVYWASQFGAVKSMPLGGGAITTLATLSGDSEELVLAFDRVYWEFLGASANAVLGVPLGGGLLATIVSGPGSFTGLGATTQAVRWIDPDGGLSVLSPDGGISKELPLGTFGEPIAYDAQNVYWVGPKDLTIWRTPLGGGTSTSLATSGQPIYIVVDATSVYWSDRAVDAVLKVPIGGGVPVTVADGIFNPMHLAVDATSVYWTSFGDVIGKAPK